MGCDARMRLLFPVSKAVIRHLLKSTIFLTLLFTTFVVLRDDLSPSSRVVLETSEPSPTPVPLQEEGDIKVVLVTQYRGGSTFLGEMLNSNPEAFYWYEPLAAPTFEFRKSIHTTHPFQHENGTIRQLPDDFLHNIQDILHRILDCDIEKVDIRVLQHYFVTSWRKSAKIVPYSKCLHKNFTEARVKECIPVMTSQCLSSNVRAVKTIRFMMYMTEAMLQRNPSLKFIMYVRDPRGTILSRWGIEKKLRTLDIFHQRQHAYELCSRLQYDYDIFQKLSPRYPGRFLLIRYEDLALFPHETSKVIYRFLGKALPPNVATFIDTHTKSTKSVKAALGTNRNSSAVAERWRTDMTTEEQIIISSQCTRILKTFGYSQR